MSAIFLLPVVLPVMWPAIAAAAVAAAGAMGFAAGKTRAGAAAARAAARAATAREVEIPLESAEVVTGSLALGESLTFVREDIRAVFSRDERGRLSLHVCGEHRSEEELRAVGQELARRVTQQYAYHRLVTELKSRHFQVVGEQVEADGTVRLQVRVFQG